MMMVGHSKGIIVMKTNNKKDSNSNKVREEVLRAMGWAAITLTIFASLSHLILAPHPDNFLGFVGLIISALALSYILINDIPGTTQHDNDDK